MDFIWFLGVFVIIVWVIKAIMRLARNATPVQLGLQKSFDPTTGLFKMEGNQFFSCGKWAFSPYVSCDNNKALQLRMRWRCEGAQPTTVSIFDSSHNCLILETFHRLNNSASCLGLTMSGDSEISPEIAMKLHGELHIVPAYQKPVEMIMNEQFTSQLQLCVQYYLNNR